MIDQWSLVETTRYLNDGLQCVAEFNASNGLLRRQVWGLDLDGSRGGLGGIGGLLWIVSTANGTHYAAPDGSGNVVALFGTSGTETARYEYGPFGELLRMSGTPIAAENPWRFSSKRQDPTTDWVHYEFRVYDPSSGRWLSRDPIGEAGGENLYGFVGNDPVNRVDLFGLRVPRTPNEYLYKVQHIIDVQKAMMELMARMGICDGGCGFEKADLLREYRALERLLAVMEREAAIAGSRLQSATGPDDPIPLTALFGPTHIEPISPKALIQPTLENLEGPPLNDSEAQAISSNYFYPEGHSNEGEFFGYNESGINESPELYVGAGPITLAKGACGALSACGKITFAGIQRAGAAIGRTGKHLVEKWGCLHGQKIRDKANELKKLLNRVNQRNKNFPSICQDRLRPMLEELKRKIDDAISTINALKNTPPPAQ